MNKFLQLMFLCHQMPSRSFFYKGKQFPICARCTGLLVGYFVFIPIAIIYEPSLLLIIWLLLPMLIDGTVQRYTSYESNNILRLLTGILGGIGILMIFYYLAVLGYQFGYELGLKHL